MTRVGTALVLILSGFLAYEAYAVARARALTPALLQLHARPELPLTALSQDRRAALLTVEDPNFYGHEGLDFSTRGQGRTNLTQALVKRLYVRRFTSGFAKIEQSLIAWLVLDPAVSKPRQLELFVNLASFGHVRGRPVIGFADAARTFHGRSMDALTDRQYLSLVAMLIAPNRLDPQRHAAANAGPVRRIEAFLEARCRPADRDDVWYRHC